MTTPRIVLVAGANGSGKTFLAGRLAAALDFDHRLGTGFVREVLRSAVSRDVEPMLFEYSFAPPDPVQTLRRQAFRLRPAIIACIRRAHAEGTSLIVEGTHILPELYAQVPGVTFRLLLRVPDNPENHRQRVNGPGHTCRTTFGDRELALIRQVDHYLAGSAAEHNFIELPEPATVAHVAGLLAVG